MPWSWLGGRLQHPDPVNYKNHCANSHASRFKRVIATVSGVKSSHPKSRFHVISHCALRQGTNAHNPEASFYWQCFQDPWSRGWERLHPRKETKVYPLLKCQLLTCYKTPADCNSWRLPGKHSTKGAMFLLHTGLDRPPFQHSKQQQSSLQLRTRG